MKKTKILVRGYCCTFEITVLKKEHLTIEQASEYVVKNIIDTAQVITVTHLHQDSETVYKNEFYKDPTAFEFDAKRIA